MPSSLSHLLRRAYCTSTLPSPLSSIKSFSESLYREGNLKRLVEKFKQFSEFERFRTKTGIYEDTVRRLVNAKRYRWVEEILEHQKKYRDISKEGFSVRLISLYGKSGLFPLAHKLFDEMPERNCERTVKSFNALLGACVNSKKFGMVDVLFRELPEKLAVEPDVVSYNTVIKAFSEMGSLDSAISMFDEMEKNGLRPDLITFNTLLDALNGNDRFSDGEKIWTKMRSYNVSPDIRSYNSRMAGLILDDKVNEAVALIEEMKIKGFTPDVFSFNHLIKGFCNDGDLEEAKRWYDQLGKTKTKPNKVTFATLVPLACEEGDLDFALQLCKDIFHRRCLVDGSLLQQVVDGLVKNSRIEEAKKVVKLGVSNNYSLYKLKIPPEH
ncbi:hypothetical protein Nepgr_028748 [Nepenthes gracilis]|uniref:Pentatricopeptide repeat-containing protein n=1 Tax=Nepenthes gracilis TaxID=150966 RepID=A0AAD3TC93_NEPGR|nr:hypothetical protein Nepgr_028748 [Nepenthes gracilis]